VVENAGLDALESVRVRLTLPEGIEIYFEELHPDVPPRPNPHSLPTAHPSSLNSIGAQTTWVGQVTLM